MALDARTALRQGADDLTTRRGAILYVLFTLFALASLPVHQTLTSQLYATMRDVAELTANDLPTPATPLAVDMNPLVLTALLAAVFLVAEILRFVAIRSFASESSEPIPMADVTRRLLPAFLTLLVVSFVVQIMVYVGFILLLPGLAAIFLTVFARQAVVLDDAGPIAAIKETASITVDEPLNVLLLLVTLIVLSFVVGIPTLVLPAGSAASAIAGAVLGSILTVYGITVITRAYQQAQDGSKQALGPDDLDAQAEAEAGDGAPEADFTDDQ